MNKRAKGIQISDRLHQALEMEKLNLGFRSGNPNVTFQEVVEDLLDRAQNYENILMRLMVDHPETKAWAKKIAKEYKCYECVKNVTM
jgi:hypothetical protein